MEAINPVKRAELGKMLHAKTQDEVMSLIPQFSEAEIQSCDGCVPNSIDSIHALVFNIERGDNCDAIIEFLKMCPNIQPYDLILANELDDGCIRTDERDITDEIARALNMHYVFALEFIELREETAKKGYHGNAIFSRFPIKWAKVLRLPEENNWFLDRQTRIGGRCAIFAELEIGNRSFGVVSIHLENRTSGEGRQRQMQAIYDETLSLFPDMPILLGGDLNTNTFDGRNIEEIQDLYKNQDELMMRIKNPEKYEPLLFAGETSGFEFRESACEGVTRRKPLPGGSMLEIRLDWFLSRGLEVEDKRIVSTLKKDCGFVDDNSYIAKLESDELSDHNAVWAKYRLKQTPDL